MNKICRNLLLTLFILLSFNPIFSQNNYKIHLYLVPFENSDQTSSLDWLRNGMMDMVATHFQYSTLVKVHFQEELDQISRKRKPLSAEQLHLLLVGNYFRRNDTLEIELQLLDLSTWLSLDLRKLKVPMRKLSSLSDLMSTEVDKMLEIQYRLKFGKQKKVEGEKPSEASRPPEKISVMSREGKALNKQLEIAVKNFENTLDRYLGIRGESEETDTRQEGTYYVKTFTRRPFSTPEVNRPKSMQSVRGILEQISISPYRIVISEPEYEGIPLQPDLIRVKILIKYQLKSSLITDLLEIIPLKDVEQNKDYKVYHLLDNIFYFDPGLNYSISKGEYRLFPVINFIDQENKELITILDIPASIYYRYESIKLYEGVDLIKPPQYTVLKNLPDYYFVTRFKPLININSSLKSVNVYIDREDTETITYEIDVPIEAMTRVVGARVHFEPESEIVRLYLK